MMETNGISAPSGETHLGPRALIYAGSDAEYFEEWRRHLTASDSPWKAGRFQDFKELAPGSIASVFVDLLSPDSEAENLLASMRKTEPDLPVILLAGLDSSEEDLSRWNALDSFYRMDWERLRALTRWISLLQDRKAARAVSEELRGARDALEAILGAIPDAVTVLNRGGKMIYANLEAARVLGFNAVADLILSDPRDISRRYEILTEQGQPFPLEQLPGRLASKGLGPVSPRLLQWRHRESREIHWSLVTAVALKNPDGTVSNVVTTSQNVTDLKRVELALKESEERFRHLAEAALEGIALVRDGRILEVNLAFAGMFGMPPSFFKNLPPDRFFEVGTHPSLRRALMGEGEESFEGMARMPGGRNFPVLLRGKRSVQQGKTLQMLSLRNLAAERRLEEESNRLFQMSPDLLIVVTADGYPKRLSASWERASGFSLGEIYQVPVWEFIHAEDLAVSKAALAKLAQGGPLFNFENRIRCKDGSYRWIQWNSCMLPSRDLFLGIGRDITEERRKQREILEAQKRLQEQSRAMDHALTRVIRSLRAPVEALGDRAAESARMEIFLAELESIVGFDAGGPSPELENFDFGSLLADAASSLGDAPEMILDPKTPRLLRSDPARLRTFLARLFYLWAQVVSGQPWRLKVSLQGRDRDQLWVELCLEAQEIPSSEKKTAPPPSAVDPELALLLCGAWVRKWGGRLHAGAAAPSFRFSLAFPFQSAPAAEAGSNAPRILVAEDHPVNQRLMIEFLEKLGPFRVTVAESGQDAVREQAATRFDLVLMDCHLPGMNGMEAARRIRMQEAETGRRVPIIAITADAMDSTRALCLDAGMDDFLTKPVLMQDLASALARGLARGSAKADPGMNRESGWKAV